MFSSKTDHGVTVNNFLKFSIQNILQSAAAERGTSAVAAAVSAAVAAAASRLASNLILSVLHSGKGLRQFFCESLKYLS